MLQSAVLAPARTAGPPRLGRQGRYDRADGPQRINRRETCPTLIRIIVKDNEAFREDEFRSIEKPKGTREVHIHHWMDANLRDLTELLKETEKTAHLPKPARHGSAKVEFSHLYSDRKGGFTIKRIGVVESLNRTQDDLKTLQSFSFCLGDYLTANIMSDRKADETTDSMDTEASSNPPNESDPTIQRVEDKPTEMETAEQ
ncbi:Histone deacetylase complex subunit SAP18 [Planoprotostelium fungivorum]|uniref:Histone deacetylase complex subunit SAP18 n=1 Tax=Planoprotostelium fungivorum TaxID=1890364 RepID=A0A2P6NC98_9EUKA|nr:Histone deacetylase complex subunit SAP18 [Planoprotostelium fungivorum]